MHNICMLMHDSCVCPYWYTYSRGAFESKAARKVVECSVTRGAFRLQDLFLDVLSRCKHFALLLAHPLQPSKLLPNTQPLLNSWHVDSCLHKHALTVQSHTHSWVSSVISALGMVARCTKQHWHARHVMTAWCVPHAHVTPDVHGIYIYIYIYIYITYNTLSQAIEIGRNVCWSTCMQPPRDMAWLDVTSRQDSCLMFEKQ